MQEAIDLYGAPIATPLEASTADWIHALGTPYGDRRAVMHAFSEQLRASLRLPRQEVRMIDVAFGILSANPNPMGVLPQTELVNAQRVIAEQLEDRELMTALLQTEEEVVPIIHEALRRDTSGVHELNYETAERAKIALAYIIERLTDDPQSRFLAWETLGQEALVQTLIAAASPNTYSLSEEQQQIQKHRQLQAMRALFPFAVDAAYQQQVAAVFFDKQSLTVVSQIFAIEHGNDTVDYYEESLRHHTALIFNRFAQNPRFRPLVLHTLADGEISQAVNSYLQSEVDLPQEGLHQKRGYQKFVYRERTRDALLTTLLTLLQDDDEGSKETIAKGYLEGLIAIFGRNLNHIDMYELHRDYCLEPGIDVDEKVGQILSILSQDPEISILLKEAFDPMDSHGGKSK